MHRRALGRHEPAAALLGDADELLRRAHAGAARGRLRRKRLRIVVKGEVDRLVRAIVAVVVIIVQPDAARAAMLQHGQDDERGERGQHHDADDDQHEHERAVPARRPRAQGRSRRQRGGGRRIRRHRIGDGEHRAGELPLRPGGIDRADGEVQVARGADDQLLLEDGIPGDEHIVRGELAERRFRQDGLRQLHGAGVADGHAHAHRAGLRGPRLQYLRQQGHVELRIVHERVHLVGLFVDGVVRLAERVRPVQHEGDVAHRLRCDGHDQIGIRPALPRVERECALVHGVAELVRDADVGHGLVAAVDGRQRERHARGGGRPHLHLEGDIHQHHRQRDRLDGGKRLGLAVHIVGDDGRGGHVLLAHGVDEGLRERRAGVERVVAQDGVVADLLVDDGDIGHIKMRLVGKLIRQRDRIARLCKLAVHRARNGDDRLHGARDGHGHVHAERLAIAQPAHMEQQLQPDARIRHLIEQREHRRAAGRDDAVLHARDGEGGVVQADGDLMQLKIGIVGDLERELHGPALGQLRRVRRHLDAHLLVRRQRAHAGRSERQQEQQAQQRV